MEKGPVETFETPPLHDPTLIVCWQTRDIGRLASSVVDRLNQGTEARTIAEMKPLGFFLFKGITFREDLVNVPACQFWASERKNLLIVRSDEPDAQHYLFLSALLEFALGHYRVGEMYTVNGTVSFSPHTRPRRILGVFNDPGFREKLGGYGLEDLTWEGAPALSSYLLWLAGKRGLQGVSLWSEIPFYLAAREDPQAVLSTLSFFNRRFRLSLETADLDGKIRDQNERISTLRKENPEVDRSIQLLEKDMELDQEQQVNLVTEVSRFLERR